MHPNKKKEKKLENSTRHYKNKQNLIISRELNAMPGKIDIFGEPTINSNRHELRHFATYNKLKIIYRLKNYISTGCESSQRE